VLQRARFVFRLLVFFFGAVALWPLIEFQISGSLEQLTAHFFSPSPAAGDVLHVPFSRHECEVLLSHLRSAPQLDYERRLLAACAQLPGRTVLDVGRFLDLLPSVVCAFLCVYVCVYVCVRCVTLFFDFSFFRFSSYGCGCWKCNVWLRPCE
jgi:hypothetical protein